MGQWRGGAGVCVWLELIPLTGSVRVGIVQGGTQVARQDALGQRSVRLM